MTAMIDKPLSFLATNAIVADFKALVDWAANGKKVSDHNKHTSGLSKKHEATLDKELHDRALSLPDAKAVSLKKIDKSSKHQYGKFTGKQVYRDYTGDVILTDKDAVAKPLLKASGTSDASGWLTLFNTKSDRAMFRWRESCYVIQIIDFELDDIVEDFQPLYDKLREEQIKQNESIANDTKQASSKAASNKEESSNAINSDSDSVDSNGANVEQEKADTNEQTTSNANRDYQYLGSVYPKQVCSKNDFSKRNDNVYNNVQAVVYDLPGFKDVKADNPLDSSNHHLFCYQQPENVSYTAAAQFDSVAPRGSQQPFQFYVTANAMSLSFTLKWHIDEIRTLERESGKSMDIQDIADIAEGFTRPWNNGTSLQPKLCKVILPGISQIGYITEAQIQYSGDMTGNYTSAAGVLLNGNTPNSIYNYFYSQIDVTFSMIIVKDITLWTTSEDKWHIEIHGDDGEGKSGTEKASQSSPASSPDNNQANIPAGEVSDTTNNSSNTVEASSAVDGIASSSNSLPSDGMPSSVPSEGLDFSNDEIDETVWGKVQEPTFGIDSESAYYQDEYGARYNYDENVTDSEGCNYYKNPNTDTYIKVDPDEPDKVHYQTGTDDNGYPVFD